MIDILLLLFCLVVLLVLLSPLFALAFWMWTKHRARLEADDEREFRRLERTAYFDTQKSIAKRLIELQEESPQSGAR